MLRLPSCLTIVVILLLAAPAAANAAFAGALLRALPTKVESNSPAYNRAQYKHWTDADGDGCTTRFEVLFRQNAKRASSTCNAATGNWLSVYDGERFTAARQLDVDHMVPLRQAHVSGGRLWNADTRQRFANDLAYRPSLIAVSASSNRSKSDQDPAEWMPPLATYHCRYVVNWVAVKYRWRLSVDAAERTAIQNAFKGCPASIIKLAAPPRAVIGTGSTPAAPSTGSGSTGGSGTTGGDSSIPLQPDRPGDQDCSDFDGPVRVLPGDPDDLDRDGDGIGCE